MGEKCAKCGVAHASRRATRLAEAVKAARVKATRDVQEGRWK